jgi:DNA polymerase-3 subunit delta'
MYTPAMPAVSLHELLGQSHASGFLRGVIAGGRYANAYLFHGAPGVGKGTAALAFARAILCHSVAAAAEAAPGLFDAAPDAGLARAERPADDACGLCAACAKSAALQHPDLRFLFPVSGEERALDTTIAETLAAWREDPFYVFTYERAASIRLSITRELLRELAYKPFEANHRVVVVRDADRMREDQYSAMLKSIEEPGAATVWILTTGRLARIPATIRSRCQSVRFAPLPEAEVVTFLESRVGTPGRDARMLAALSAGSLAKALTLRDENPVELRNQALALLEPAGRGDAAGLWKAATAMTRFGKAGRETLRQMVEFQQLWLRDLLRARYDAPRETLVNRDREADIRRQAQTVSAEEMRRRLMVLEEMIRAIDGNVTPELAIFSGVSRVAGERFGEHDWPKHSTARWSY